MEASRTTASLQSSELENTNAFHAAKFFNTLKSPFLERSSARLPLDSEVETAQSLPTDTVRRVRQMVRRGYRREDLLISASHPAMVDAAKTEANAFDRAVAKYARLRLSANQSAMKSTIKRHATS